MYVCIYVSSKSNLCPDRRFSVGRYKAVFSLHDFIHVNTTFYATSIGEVRFDGTFRVSELRGVGLWSDFEILAVKFGKIYH